MSGMQQPSEIALWDELAGRAEVRLRPDQHRKLLRYIELLLEANRVMNLTRITDPSAARVQHVGDALTVLPFLPPGRHRLVDVGSGGGVPGIPLAIARPDAAVTLLDATKKKAAFLRKCCSELELHGVEVVDQRAEDAGRGQLREQFDVAIARAVGRMVWLAEWCLPLVRVGGRMLALKGPRVAEELPEAAGAIKLLGGGEPAVHAVDLPGVEHHVIVEIPKMRRSPVIYPRPATSAKGRPL
jgi:16S rRNA (guanine527-N7)-methyltransferase